MTTINRFTAIAAAVALGGSIAFAQSPRAAVQDPSTLRQVGIVELRSQIAPGSCVDANALSGGVVLWSCHGGANQRFAYFNDGTLRHAGRCLGASGNSVVLKQCEGGPDTRWAIDKGMVRNESEQCVDIAGGNKANGTPILAWQCHGEDRQKWTRR